MAAEQKYNKTAKNDYPIYKSQYKKERGENYPDGPFKQISDYPSYMAAKKGLMTVDLPYIKFEIDVRTFKAMGSGAEDIQVVEAHLAVILTKKR